MNIYFYIIQFLIAFFIVFLYYRLVEMRKIKRYTKKNMPMDLQLLINLEHVDTKKISNKKLMNILSVVNAIDVGIILLMTNITESFLLKLLIAIPMIFIMLFISYTIIGLVLKKKGLTKDES